MRDITKAMKALETEIVELQGLVEATGDTGHFEALSSKRALLADLLGTRAQGALVRSRFQSISQMDTPSKFFFALEKKNGQSRYIHTLRAGDGTELTEPHEIRRRAVQFYSELYESEYVENDECFDSFCDGMPQISDDDHLELKAPLVGAELHAALQGMDGGKSPGLDGLPVEFYKTFWKELGQDLLEVFNESFRDLTLPLSCRRAVITLLPKKGDLTDIKNWRPVSLLCTDYKILSKALADRLRRVMDEVLHGVLKAWGLFKKTRMEHSVSLYWLLQEPLIGGSRMDIQDNGLPGLHHVLRSAGVLTLRQVVDAAGHGLMNTAALAARIGLRSVRYAQAMLNGWTERLTDADNELLRLYWEEEETPDEEDPFQDLGLLMNLEDCSGYKRNNAVKWKLLNFIVGEAKLSIYLTRRNKMEGSGVCDDVITVPVLYQEVDQVQGGVVGRAHREVQRRLPGLLQGATWTRASRSRDCTASHRYTILATADEHVFLEKRWSTYLELMNSFLAVLRGRGHRSVTKATSERIDR
ncbi:Transposon TX1 uncharacterized protein [Merluccius polli]|uniref:Transposon TX1 uncharacterized protein n=1 Tax=Merluccius polli TaxID=89951 RepID=A0AA47MBF7_MERPO|nr:Transposon TX1 uncharacterized protein [Merluccius polli]